VKTCRIVLIILVAAIAVSGSSTAKFYKYVDENGVVHFQDHPPVDVGPDTEVEELPEYKTKKSDRNLPRKDNKKSIGKIDYSNAQVELYVTSWCRYCNKAKEYFRSRGIPFTEYDIEKDMAAARRKNKLSPQKGVPFAVVNGRKIYGYAPEAYERALKSR
jgi:glutaredoxin-like YruB-family protein